MRKRRSKRKNILQKKIKSNTQCKKSSNSQTDGKEEPNLPANWDMVSYSIMNDILYAKFSIPDLAEKLKATGSAYLIEENYWHDNRWGKCTCEKCSQTEGFNWLGKILMEIRQEINEKAQEHTI